MSIESVMPSNHLILCHPLLLLPSIFPSVRVFSNESASGGQSIGVSASVLPMNIQDWFPLGWTGWISLLSKALTLKSLLQHHRSKASILWHSAFLIASYYSILSKHQCLLFFSCLNQVSCVTSLVVQWLRLCAPNAGGPGSVPGQGTRSHMLQRRSKIPHATTKTQCSQISKYLKSINFPVV